MVRNRDDKVWTHGFPAKNGWYITGSVGDKVVYRYWFGEVWSEAITTDNSFSIHKETGLKMSLMSSAFDKYIPLKEMPDFLKQFDELIPETLNKETT
jgi:hypothetical protein